MGCLSRQVPKTHCGIAWTTGQISTPNKDEIINSKPERTYMMRLHLHTSLLLFCKSRYLKPCKKEKKFYNQSYSLAGGAESSWDDSFCVSL